MARTSKVLTLSLPPEMLIKADELAKFENRTRSELFREALRQYIESRERWTNIRLWGQDAADKSEIRSEEDVEKLIGEFRREQK